MKTRRSIIFKIKFALLRFTLHIDRTIFFALFFFVDPFLEKQAVESTKEIDRTYHVSADRYSSFVRFYAFPRAFYAFPSIVRGLIDVVQPNTYMYNVRLHMHNCIDHFLHRMDILQTFVCLQGNHVSCVVNRNKKK